MRQLSSPQLHVKSIARPLGQTWFATDVAGYAVVFRWLSPDERDSLESGALSPAVYVARILRDVATFDDDVVPGGST